MTEAESPLDHGAAMRYESTIESREARERCVNESEQTERGRGPRGRGRGARARRACAPAWVSRPTDLT
eukprot:2192796-Pleurochrysis_carterae.AAC.1